MESPSKSEQTLQVNTSPESYFEDLMCCIQEDLQLVKTGIANSTFDLSEINQLEAEFDFYDEELKFLSHPPICPTCQLRLELSEMKVIWALYELKRHRNEILDMVPEFTRENGLKMK